MRLLSVRVTTDDKKGSDERREGINETRQGADMVHGTTVLHAHAHAHAHVVTVKSAKVPPTPSA